MVNGVGGSGGAGRGGGVPPAGAPVAPEAAGVERARFGASVDAPAQAQGPAQAGAASPFERLRAGEIDLPRYVELRVQEATAHLEGVVPPVDLEAIRAELREVVESDPDVAALARAAQIGS